MPTHDIIVIGASAGGVEALRATVGALPADLPAAVFVVLHLPPEPPSLLPTILQRYGHLPATHANDREPIEPGRVYVAQPDCHLIVEYGHVRAVHGPKENRHRPAVDPLFRSAARSYGPRVQGVILTGNLDDGTAGLRAIKQRGGVAIVQDPMEALYPGMPSSAIRNVAVDHIMPLADIPELLVRLAHEPAQDSAIFPVPKELDIETRIATMEANDVEHVSKIGQPSMFTCPECHGTLWEMQDSNLLRFRCQVGHAYTVDSMMADQTEAVERALWAALRALEERVALTRRLANRARENNHPQSAIRFAESTEETEQHAAVIKQILETNHGREAETA
jgi:two-component system chemotaxis response regulator CheB